MISLRRRAAAPPGAWLLAAPLVVALAACPHPAARPPAPPPPPPAPVVTDDAPPVGRLDDRARPRAARLELEVDPRADDVAGTITLDVELTRPLRVIWLHARDLEVGAARVTDRAGVVHPARVVPDTALEHTDGQGELIGLAVDGALLPGPATVELAYRAPWGTGAGLLRSTDVGPMAVTDLSPADARSVMPCFDDPRFKIPWTVALTIPADLAAFANYPERSRAPAGPGRTRVEFEPTRPLPPHLVAFTVGALVTVDAGQAPVPMRIITVAGSEPRMAHAAAQLGGLLTTLSAYVDEPVPFPKLDVVAVPTLSGQVVGMENPGLITVRADSLEVEPSAPRWTATWVTSILAHELSHLWFGDLVSVAWWDEFWLNEGFATWLTDKVMAAREPGWTMVEHPFAPWIMMTQDPPGSGPVRRPLRTLDDYPRILDLKAYARGAAVVATLEAWLGPDRFRDLVRAWIDRHRDGSVTTALLVDELAAAGPRAADGQPATRALLEAAVAGLVDHAGVPEARFALRCEAGPPRLDVAVAHGPADAPWPLPVCARVDGQAAPVCALVQGAASLELAGACPRWLVPNPGARAYYRPLLAPGLLAAALAAGVTRDERAMLTRAADDGGGPASLDDGLRMAITCDLDDLPWCRGELEPLVLRVVTAARRPALLARLSAMLPADALGFDRGEGRGRTAAAQRSLLLASLGDRAQAAAARAPAAALVRGARGDLWHASAVLAAAAAADPALWPRYLRHVRAADDPMATAFAAGLGGFQDRRAFARLERLLDERALSARLRRRVLAAAFVNPALRDRRRELAARAAPHLSASELEGELGSWCGADDERAAAELLRSRGADDAQVERATGRIAACSARAAALAADAAALDP